MNSLPRLVGNAVDNVSVNISKSSSFNGKSLMVLNDSNGGERKIEKMALRRPQFDEINCNGIYAGDGKVNFVEVQKPGNITEWHVRIDAEDGVAEIGYNSSLKSADIYAETIKMEASFSKIIVDDDIEITADVSMTLNSNELLDLHCEAVNIRDDDTDIATFTTDGVYLPFLTDHNKYGSLWLLQIKPTYDDNYAPCSSADNAILKYESGEWQILIDGHDDSIKMDICKKIEGMGISSIIKSSAVNTSLKFKLFWPIYMEGGNDYDEQNPCPQHDQIVLARLLSSYES